MSRLILLALTLLLSFACQWHQPGKLSIHSNAQPQTTQQTEALIRESSHGAAVSTAGRFTAGDFARHVAQLKKRLPSNEFSIVVQAPFVVVGDEPRPDVQKRAEGTVKWAVDKLKQDFFINDPNVILDVWLFKDEASYEKHNRLLFGEPPTTPYGYYSSHHKALIMNIATGG